MKTFFLCFFILNSLVSVAQEGSTFLPVENKNPILERILNQSKKINSIKAMIIQEKKSDMLTDKVVSKGTMVFKKKDKMRIEYTYPFQYLLIMDGNQLIVKEKNKVRKLSINSSAMFRQMNKLMIGSIDGSILLDPGFNISFAENNKQYQLLIIPQQAGIKKIIKSVEILLDKKSLVVDNFTITEKSGDFTRMTFREVVYDTPMPDQYFNVD